MRTKAALVKLAKENPFQFFTFGEIALMCGWGETVPGSLAAVGAPVAGRKMNPHILVQWMTQNPEEVAKAKRES